MTINNRRRRGACRFHVVVSPQPNTNFNMFSKTSNSCVKLLLVASCITLQSLCTPAYAESSRERDYQSTLIIEPEEGQVIRRPGTFSVIADVEPNLQSGHRMQLFLDGEVYNMPNTEGRFSVTSTTSGQHQLQVKIIDQSSSVLESSALRTITVE